MRYVDHFVVLSAARERSLGEGWLALVLLLELVLVEVVLGELVLLELRLSAVAVLLASEGRLERLVHWLLVSASSAVRLERGLGVRIHRVRKLLVVLLVEGRERRGRRHLVLLEVQNIGRLLPVPLGRLRNVLLLRIERKIG